MAVLRLDLEIDSEIHPELYARLASLGRRAAREEKLRQLAATGLIWEVVRLHGPAFVDLGPAENAAAATRAGKPMRAPMPPVPAPEPLPPPAATLTPTPAPAAVDAGAVADHPPWVPTDVPVLLDIVAEIESGAPDDIEAGIPADEPGGPPPWSAEDARRALAEAALLRGMTPAPEPGSDVAGGKRLSARLKRMKEQGLFRNG
jgi:hypothetical protein